jgi:transposase-like protein
MDTAMASIFAVRRWWMSTTRRSFTAEFKADAVRQVTELGRLLSQVARELSLRRLRRELAGLRQEHEFLGNAAACFASGPARGTPCARALGARPR